MSSINAKAIPFHFESTSTPQPFTIATNPDFIKQTVDKVKGYRPSTDLDDDSNGDWSDGPPAARMTALAEYWSSEYDWDTLQAEMNSQFSHFTVTIPESSRYAAELPLHFVHERSKVEDATPLLLLHGWPSSHLEWQKVIGPLVSPEDTDSKSFHVVAPDMPGSGFSPAPTVAGLGPREMALAFDQLMSTLGYPKYGIVTTDLGWELGMWMVSDVGENIIGHMADFFIPQPSQSDFGRLQSNLTTPQETEYLQSLQAYMNNHAAYATIQAQAPLTLAQALADTPVGYAGWIWHLMNAVSDGYAYTMDEVITSTMMLWLQGPYGNLRTYKEFYKVRSILSEQSYIP